MLAFKKGFALLLAAFIAAVLMCKSFAADIPPLEFEQLVLQDERAW